MGNNFMRSSVCGGGGGWGFKNNVLCTFFFSLKKCFLLEAFSIILNLPSLELIGLMRVFTDMIMTKIQPTGQLVDSCEKKKKKHNQNSWFPDWINPYEEKKKNFIQMYHRR